MGAAHSSTPRAMAPLISSPPHESALNAARAAHELALLHLAWARHGLWQACCAHLSPAISKPCSSCPALQLRHPLPSCPSNALSCDRSPASSPARVAHLSCHPPAAIGRRANAKCPAGVAGELGGRCARQLGQQSPACNWPPAAAVPRPLPICDRLPIEDAHRPGGRRPGRRPGRQLWRGRCCRPGRRHQLAVSTNLPSAPSPQALWINIYL